MVDEEVKSSSGVSRQGNVTLTEHGIEETRDF